MRKEKYSVNIYKLSRQYSNDELLGIFTSKMEDGGNRQAATQGSLSDEGFDIVYYAYKIQFVNDSDIKWYEKWKDFFNLSDPLRSFSMTGHGVICIQNRTRGYSFVLVFGRAFVLISDLIEYDYGISMADKLFDGKSADAISSKYFSMVKNKSIFDYYEGSSMFIEDGQAVDIIKSKAIEDPNRKADLYITKILENISPMLTVSYSYLHITLMKENIYFTDVITTLDYLYGIEMNYTSRFPIPRMRPVPKIKQQLLDGTLLNWLKLDLESDELLISVPFYFKDDSDGYSFLAGVEEFTLSYRGKSEVFEELEHEDVKAFLIANNVVEIRDVLLTAKSGTSNKKIGLMNWIDTQLVIDDETYVLFEGRWCTFNQAYIERINQKVRFLEKDHVKVKHEFSVTSDQLSQYFDLNRDELTMAFTGGKSPSVPYNEFIYNYMLSRKSEWALFDRVLFKSIEICDLAITNKAHIHVKMGDSSKLEEELRQSIAGIRIFEREKVAILNEIQSFDGIKITEPKLIVVLYLSDHTRKSGIPSESSSLKLKQTFIDWAEEVKNSRKDYLLVLAKISATGLHSTVIWDRLEKCDL